MNQLFLCSGHFGDNLTVISPLPIALDAVISSSRQRGAFVKEKSAGRPRVSEEIMERVRQSFFNLLWLLSLGLREGQSVCATTTREHTWFGEQNYRCCGDHPTWLGRNWTIASMCAMWRRVHTSNICRHVTCRVTVSFPLVFIILFTILVNIINFETAPIILIHPLLKSEFCSFQGCKYQHYCLLIFYHKLW